MNQHLKSHFLLAFCGIFWANLMFGQISVGVISDYAKSERTEKLVADIIAEMDKTTGATRKIVSPNQVKFYGIAESEQATEAYQGLTSQKIVLALGPISTKALSQIGNLPIPVIGVGVFDPELQNIPYQNGRSGKKNFTYIWSSKEIKKEIESFKKIHPFDRLTLLVDPSIQKTIDQASASNLLASIAKDQNITFDIVSAKENVIETTEEIGVAEAVFLAPLNDKEPAYIQSLAEYFIQEKIPSYSISKQNVDYGILCSSSDENSWDQITKRIGIIADGILSGADISEQAVALSTKDKFYLNIETARKMAFSPPFEVLFTSTLVGDVNANQKAYTFYEIANKALEQNLDIKVSYQDIEIANWDVKSNRSILFPSLTSSLSGTQINEERANAAINSPERSLNGDLTLQQVIYSPEAIAAIKISKYLQQAQVYQTETDVLNVLLNVYQSYLNVLTAKTNVAIQQKNLENTRTNLDLATVRVQIGASNNADLYRWQSELANASQSVIEAQTLLMTAKFQLNTFLANTLEDNFDIADIEMNDDLFKSIQKGPIADMVKTPDDLRLASDFLVQEMMLQNPNKKVLAENINAIERQLALTKQLFYLPTLALQAQTTQVFARGGVGSEIDPTDPTQQALGGLQDNSWYVGASLSFPIFSGFSRRIDMKKSSIQLEQLNTTNLNLEQNLSLAIRANMLSLLSASTNLGYSQTSAESANQNFALIQNNYKSGTVNITQVIDAQQAAIGADLAAAVSVYEFMSANLQLEYSVGFFTMFSTEDENDALRTRFIEFISSH